MINSVFYSTLLAAGISGWEIAVLVVCLIAVLSLHMRFNSLKNAVSGEGKAAAVQTPQAGKVVLDKQIDNNETVAAIMAALTVVLEQENASSGNTVGFVVRSIKKFNSGRK